MLLPKSPVGQALQTVLPRWDGLVRYCENGSLSIDNNLSERMVRPVAIGRKNYLFLGSANGGTAAAVSLQRPGERQGESGRAVYVRARPARPVVKTFAARGYGATS